MVEGKKPRAQIQSIAGEAQPRASLVRGRPGVGHTPGFTEEAMAPGGDCAVKPGGGPTPPRARATVHITPPPRLLCMTVEYAHAMTQRVVWRTLYTFD